MPNIRTSRVLISKTYIDLVILVLILFIVKAEMLSVIFIFEDTNLINMT